MQAGVYLHIPFCRSRCSYCAFQTEVYKSGEAVERYVSALTKEIENFQLQKSEIRNPKSKISIDTVYFGGGTPSLLTPNQLEKILNTICKNFSVSTDAEITLEINPATVTLKSLQEYKILGVNRASFGAQTFDDTELKRLGRRHSAQDVRETIELLRKAGFANVSFDLIAGLPRQSLKDWEKNLDEALRLAPEHLSLYLLEIHEATPLAEQIRSGRQPLPDEELAAEMYELMLEKVATKGFEQYEISNFCQSGFESKHNSKYWLCEPVFAFGCSAHSFDGTKIRWANERDRVKYVEAIESKGAAVSEQNEINAQSEFVFLGLRLTKGVCLDEYKNRFGIDLREEYAEELKLLEEAELIEFDKNRLKLTRRGFLFSNEVFSVFV